MGCSGSKHGTSGYSDLSKEKDASKPLNVIILGGHKVGKSTVGNAILGRRVFTFWSFFHKGCVEKQRNVNGRFIKVVHAPGWTGFNHTTSAYNKGEIKHSIIREGRVAFVLVVSIDSQFTAQDLEAANQHMELIGGSVWEHTVLVFIKHRSDNQTDRRKSDIPESVTNLVCLLHKCDSRLFLFNKDNDQVTDLLRLLDDVAMQSGIRPKNSACSQNSQMCRQCPEERAEKENGGLQQKNIELQQQATTSIQRGTTHELTSASENTSGQLRQVYNIRTPDSQQDRQNAKENVGKLLERRCSTLMANKTAQKQEMATFSRRFPVSITDTTGPIDEKLEDYKHLSAPFVDENRAEVRSVTAENARADAFYREKMVDHNLYSQERMRLVYRAFASAEALNAALLELLKQEEPHLVEDLDRQNAKENMEKLVERRCSTLMAIKTALKQEMADFCRFLVSITDTTGPIDEKLEDFKHQSVLFVDENRAALIKRVPTPILIADSLFTKNMVDCQLYEEIQKEEIKPKSMRLIYTALNADAKKVAFLELLIQKDRYLVRDLAEKKLEAIMKKCR